MQFISVETLLDMVADLGLENVLKGVADRIELDFQRWPSFEKSPRYASHSPGGVIELMPTSDGEYFAFKYVNGHPGNAALGLQTVAAFGVLADVRTGYPLLISEMTVATALRTAATSALAAKHLARADSETMAIIGLGAQAEFQAHAFRALLGVRKLRVFDVDDAATQKFMANLASTGFEIVVADSAPEATLGADIITTVTADKRCATIVSDNMVGSGVHINAVGGDCPGKTELQRDVVCRSSVFVEYAPQTRIEGEIQQVPPDFPVTELWEVISSGAPGRRSDAEITMFDSVGFAIEDFSMLRYLHECTTGTGWARPIDLLAQPGDPRDVFGLLGRAIDARKHDQTAHRAAA